MRETYRDAGELVEAEGRDEAEEGDQDDEASKDHKASEGPEQGGCGVGCVSLDEVVHCCVFIVVYLDAEVEGESCKSLVLEWITKKQIALTISAYQMKDL